MGFSDWFKKAKTEVEKVDVQEVVEDVKAVATDEKIDQAVDAIQSIAPDSLDAKVEDLGEKAKGLND